jgi:hypothetical protein
MLLRPVLLCISTAKAGCVFHWERCVSGQAGKASHSSRVGERLNLIIGIFPMHTLNKVDPFLV